MYFTCAHAVRVRDADLGEAVAAFVENDEVLKRIQVLEKYIRAMRDDFAPIFLRGLFDRRDHQFEVLGVLVGDDKELIVMMTDQILQARDARLKDFEILARAISWQDAPLIRDGRAGE